MTEVHATLDNVEKLHLEKLKLTSLFISAEKIDRLMSNHAHVKNTKARPVGPFLEEAETLITSINLWFLMNASPHLENNEKVRFFLRLETLSKMMMSSCYSASRVKVYPKSILEGLGNCLPDPNLFKLSAKVEAELELAEPPKAEVKTETVEI